MSQLHRVNASQAHQRNNDKKMHTFLNYVATHQVAVVAYHASDMGLVVYDDASYLSKPKACS
jgi:hypothetical protein